MPSAQCTPPEEKYQVVTIYFAGTGLTEDWWNGPQAVGAFGRGFRSPESVATLHHWQQESETHKKHFVNGIGTGCAKPDYLTFLRDLFDLINQGFPNLEGCKGWESSLSEAELFLRTELGNTTRQVILNLVGLSRGGVLTMRFADRIYSQADIRDRIDRINIIAYEPAAGDTTLPHGEFILNPLVSRYVGMYAEDERARWFAPTIPSAASPETKVWMFTVPGAHETLVGNKQTDGHHSMDNQQPCGLFRNLPFPELECEDPELLRVSWVTTFIAEKLLGSAQWGNVQFDMTKLAEWHPGLNLPDSNLTFIDKVDAMWSWENYTDLFGTIDYKWMRTYSVHDIIGYESCGYGPPAEPRVWPFPFGYLYQLSGSWLTDHRCVHWFRLDNGVAEPKLTTFLELNESGLVHQLWLGDHALAKLQELGSPEPDTTPPVIPPLANLTIEATSSSGAVVSYAVPDAIDAVDGAVPLVCAPASGSTFPMGTTTVQCSATDCTGNSATATFNVTVRDTTPPVIGPVVASPQVLWPPNHQMVPIAVSYVVTDNTGATCTLAVASSEPENARGDGNTAGNARVMDARRQPPAPRTATASGSASRSPANTPGDWLIIDAANVLLRAERAGTGHGRVYAITVTCADAYGNASTAAASVAVPKSMGHGLGAPSGSRRAVGH